VRSVWLNHDGLHEGVAGVDQRSVTPSTTTTYVLEVDTGSGTVTKQTTVYVLPANSIIMSFWAEQYALADSSACTTLHWSVQNVQAVYFTDPANGTAEQGVKGESSKDVCPGGNALYKLRAVAADGTTKTKTVLLQAPPPAPNTNEVYAQGLITKVEAVTDADTTFGGNQPGWKLTIDGVNPIKGTGPQQAITIGVPQNYVTDNPAAYPSWIDWPLQPGQTVEFHATCDATSCHLKEPAYNTPVSQLHYLRQTSP
jgi:hypothetical protein